MLREAAEAGLYRSTDGTTYPKLQILTIQQIPDGKQPDYPSIAATPPSRRPPEAAPKPPRT
jgi:hypothetical protein